MDPRAALAPLCDALGIEVSDSLAKPSFNGRTLEEVYPWGTIRSATPEANRATAEELSEPERREVRTRAGLYLEALRYDGFL